MKLRKSKDQIIHDCIRGSVPQGKLDVTRIVLQDRADGDSFVGCTTYGKGDTVERLTMPRGSDSYASTVRSHETRHATFSKRWSAEVKKASRASEKLYYAANIIEDCHVEQKNLPTSRVDRSALRSYCREHMAAAIRDVNDIRRHKRICERSPMCEQNNPERRNGRILCATRALAMMRVYGVYSGSAHIGEAELALQEAIGPATFTVLERIIVMSRRKERKLKAMRLLATLLEDEDVDFPDPLPPFVIEGMGKGVGMRIEDLNPKSEWTSHEKKVTILPATSGPIVRVQRYVAAIVSGDASGLFARRHRRNPSGTVLIDASGSMHATTENVKKLCKMIPDATVAYYSGDDVSCGVLAIYAEKNKRYKGDLPAETLLGGNSVDMEALEWLIRQPKPWTLISDLGFCGSSFGGEEVAHAIVERETALNRLTVIPTFAKAFEVFSARNPAKVALPSAADIRAQSAD